MTCSPETFNLLKRLSRASGLPTDVILKLALNEWRETHCNASTIAGIELSKEDLREFNKVKTQPKLRRK